MQFRACARLAHLIQVNRSAGACPLALRHANRPRSSPPEPAPWAAWMSPPSGRASAGRCRAATARGSRTSRSRACTARPARSRSRRRWPACRACAACRSTAPRRRRAWSGRPPRQALATGSRRCSGPATAALPAADLLAAAPRRRAQRLLLWRWLVAGFCMMQVMMYAVPGLRRRSPARSRPTSQALLRWASWILTLPVLLFSCRPFFAVGLARPAPAPHRHGRAGGAGHRRSPSAPAPPPPSIPTGPLGGEVWFDSLTHVRVLPAVRAAAGAAAARPHGRLARSADAPAAGHASSGSRPTASSSAWRCAGSRPATASACCPARSSRPTAS